MGNKRILLKHGVYWALVRRGLRDIFTIKEDVARSGHLKTGYASQERCLAAARGAKDSYKLAFFNRKAYIVEGKFSVFKLLADVLDLDNVVALSLRRRCGIPRIGVVWLLHS